MTTVAEAFVTLRPDLGKFGPETQQHLSGATGALDQFGKQAGSTFDEAGKKGHGFTGVLGDIGKAAAGFLAANVIAGGVEKITGFIGNSLEQGIALGESLNAVNKIFGESSSTILDWGKNNATSFGLSQQAFNQLSTPLGAILRNAGFGLDETADKTITLTKRAADMASVFNTDVDTALQAIMSGLKGEANPLEQFGVGLSAAKVEAQAMADTGKKTTASLTDLEKQTARFNLIMKETATSEGDFAQTSGEAANAARIQQAKMEELSATIGQRLIPVQLLVTKAKLAFVELIANRVIPAVDKLGSLLSSVLGPALSVVGEIVQTFGKYLSFSASEGDYLNDFLSELPGFIRPVALFIGELVSHFGELKTEIQGFIAVLTGGAGAAAEEFGTTVLGKIALGIRAVIDQFVDIITHVGNWIVQSGLLGTALTGLSVIFDVVKGVLEALAPVVEKVVGFLVEHKVIAIALAAILGGVLVAAIGAVPIAIFAVITAIGLLVENWDALKQKALDVWNSIPGPIQTVIEFIVDFVKTKLEGMLQVVTSIFNLIVDGVRLFINIVTGDWTNAWSNIQDILRHAMDLIEGLVKSVFGNIPGLILDALGDLGNLLVNAGEQLMNGLKNGIESAGKAVVAAAKNIAQEALDAIPIVGKIFSPSKVTYEYGRQIGEGLRLGIEGMTGKTVATAGELASSTLEALRAGGTSVGGSSGALGSAPALANAGGGNVIHISMPNATIHARDASEAERSAGLFAWGLVSAVRARGY